MISPEFGAILTPENDARALAGLLRGYLEDPQLGARQGAAARVWAEQTYARPVVAAQIERLLARSASSFAGKLRPQKVRRAVRRRIFERSLSGLAALDGADR